MARSNLGVHLAIRISTHSDFWLRRKARGERPECVHYEKQPVCSVFAWLRTQINSIYIPTNEVLLQKTLFQCQIDMPEANRNTVEIHMELTLVYKPHA